MAGNKRKRYSEWGQYTDKALEESGELETLRNAWNEETERQRIAAQQYAALDEAIQNQIATAAGRRRTEDPTDPTVNFKLSLSMDRERKEREAQGKRDWASSLSDEELDAEIQKGSRYKTTALGHDVLKLLGMEKENPDQQYLEEERANREKKRDYLDQMTTVSNYMKYSDEELQNRLDELSGTNWAIDPESEAKTKELNDIKKVQKYREEKNRKNETEEWYKNAKKDLDSIPEEDKEVFDRLINAADEAGDTAYANKSIMGAGGAAVPLDIWGGSTAREEARAAREELKNRGYSDEQINDYLEKGQYLKDKTDTEEITNEFAEDIKTGNKAEKFAKIAGANLYSILTRPVQQLQGAENMVKAIGAEEGKPVNTYGNTYFAQNLDKALAQASSEEIKNNATANKTVNNILNMINSGVKEAGASAYTMAISALTAAPIVGMAGGGEAALKGVSEVINLSGMGTGTFSQTFQDAQERGLSRKQALTEAAVYGGVEAASELIGVENMWNIFENAGKKEIKNLFAEAIKNQVKQAGAEGAEEVIADVADEIADRFIAGDRSEYSEKVKKYMEEGLTEEEAKKKAGMDFFAQTLEDFAVGTISGSIGGGGATAVANASYMRKTGAKVLENEELTEKVIETAKKADPESDAYKIATETAPEEMTKDKMGAVISSLAEQQEEDLETVVAQRFEELGETKEEAKADAAEIMAAVTAGEVTEEESDKRAEKFEANENLPEVYAETLKGELTPVQNTISAVQRTVREADTKEKLDLNKVKTVEEDKSGNYVVSYRNGTKAKVSDMSLGDLDYNTRHIYQWAAHADSAEEARKILQNRPEGMGYTEYERAFTDVMHAAMVETPASEIRADYPELSDKQFETIYHHGELKAAEMAKKNTNAEQMAAVQAISEAAGIKVQIGGRDMSGSNGFYDPSDNTIYVSDKSLNPAAVVTGHELVHSMKKNAPDLYEKLDNALVKWWKENDEITYDRVYNNRANRYKDQIKEWKDAGRTEKEIEDLVNEEIVAHATEALFEKWGSMNEEDQREFAEEIVKDDRSLAEKLLDFVRELLEKFRNALKGYKATSLEARTLNRNIEMLTSFEDTFTDVLAEYGERNKAEGKTGEVVDRRGQESVGKEPKGGEVRHSKKESNYRKAVDSSVLSFIEVVESGKAGKKAYTTTNKSISKRLEREITEIVGFKVEGYKAEINRNGVSHIKIYHGSEGKRDHSMSNPEDLARIGYVIRNYDRVRLGTETGNARGFKNADGSVAKTVELQKDIGNNYYYVVVAVPDSNKKILHIVSAYINKKDTFSEMAVSNDSSRYVRNGFQSNVSSDLNVAQGSEKSNENQRKNDENLEKRKSLKEVGEDSEGKKLTADQIEYFKDSKIVDDEGRLLKVYHGTEEDFTVFDRTKGRSTMDIQGSFFSPWEIDAEGYGQKVRAYYLNIKNPAPEGTAYKALNRFKGQNNAGVKAREYLESLGYDGVNNGDEEFIAFRSEQIKLVTNEHPTEDVDIRYSNKIMDELEESGFSYEALTNLGDMTVYNASDSSLNIKKAQITSEMMPSDILKKTRENIASFNDGKNDYGSSALDNKYIHKISTGRDGILHGVKRFETDEEKENAKAAINLPAYLYEAVPINEADGRKKRQEKAYVLIGVYRDGDFDYVVRLIVNKNNGKLESINSLSAINAKKEDAAQRASGLGESLTQQTSSFDMNIASLLEIVKAHFPNELSQNAADHFGHERIKSDIKGLRYSRKEIEDINEIFEAEAERLRDLDFDKEMSRIANEEKKLNFSSKDYPVFKKMATELAKDYDSKINRDELTTMLFNTANHWVNQGNKADLTDVVRSMVGIARPLMEETRIVDNSTKGDYENLKALLGRKIALTDAQKEEIRNEKGTLQGFGMGYFTQAANGIPLDAIWPELVKESGYLLDPDINEGDMPIRLMETLEALKPKMGLAQYKENGMDENQMAIDIALDIYSRFAKMISDRTSNQSLKADIKRLTEKRIEYRKDIKREYQEKYEKLKEREERKLEKERAYFEWELEKQREQYNLAKARNDEKTAKKYKEQVEKWQAKLDAERDKNHDEILAIRARYQTQNRQRKVNQEIQKKRAAVIRTANSIGTLLASNTDKRHVPEVLKQPVNEFLSGIKFFGSGHDGAETQAEMKWAEKLEKMRMVLGDKGSYGEGATQLYHTIMDQSVDGQAESSLLNDMDNFLKAHGDELMTEMGIDTLSELNELVKGLKRAIDSMNQLYVNKRAQNVAELGDQTIRELSKKKDIHNMTRIGQAANELLNVSQLDAYSYFHRLGPAAESIYKGFRDSQNEWIRKIGEADDYMKKLIGKTDAGNWSKEVHEFTFGGRKVEITTSQIMSLYELMNRNQAKEHIIFGGIKPSDFEKGMVTVTQRRVRITEQEAAEIVNTLTEEQKRIAEGIQEFMNNQAAEWGNETTMKLYGYRRFLAKDYFPISVDKDTTDLRETSRLSGARNQGFTKETKEHAKNALMLKDIFDVFTEHVTGMATYSAYSPSLMDARKWHDYRLSPDSEILEEDPDVNPTIQGQIRDKYGADMLKYFENLIADINNERKADTAGTGFFDMFLGNAKSAAIAGNLRVVVQQVSAYMRALAVMDPKYLTAALFTKKGSQKAKEHSAIAAWKSAGHWETGIASSLKSSITGQTTARENINEKLLWLAGKADDLTWGKLWNAVELEIKDKHKNVDPGSKEFYELCEDRFDEVIDQTQVVDTVLHRSQIMRSKNGITKMLTSFMAEPTKSYNLLMNRARDWYEAVQAKDKKAAARAAGVFVRATAAFVLTAAVNAAAQSMWDAVRGAGDEPDDLDDPKERWLAYWERFLSKYVSNLTDNVNPLNLIPYAKDLMSIFSGYTNNNLNTQGLEKTVQGVTKVTKYFNNPDFRKKNTFYDAVRPLIQGLSYIGGVPFYNVMRDTVAVYQTLSGKKFGGRIYTSTQNKEALADAILAGDDEKLNAVVERMDEKDTENGYYDDAKTALRDKYRNGVISREEFEAALKETGETDSDVFFEIQKQDYIRETRTEKGYKKYGAPAQSLLDQNYAEFERVKKEYLDHGVDEKNFKTQTGTIINAAVKEEIENGTLTADKQAAYLSMYQKLGYKRDERLKQIKKWREGK